MAASHNNLNSLPRISKTDLESSDPSRLNRILNLLAQKIPTDQGITQLIATYITNNSTSGGGGGGGGGTTSGVTILSDTHANRLLNFPASSYPVNSLFWETDREILYICQFPALSAGNIWQCALGTNRNVYASRPTDVGTYDDGFLFYATDKQLTYRWTGLAWTTVSNFEPVIQDTHANRLASYPSTFYPTGMEFFETDRSARYIVENASGTVTVAGGVNVTWTAGHHFVNSAPGFVAAQWPAATAIVIAGISYGISVTLTATTLTLSSAAPNGAGQAYSVASGRWVYETGDYLAAYASKPTDTGENDANFVFQDNATYYRSWTWTGTAWKYTVGQPPYLAVQMTMVNTADPGWVAADGSAGVTVTKSDGTTTTVTLPNPVGYYPKGGVYSGTQVAAVAPGFSGTSASGNAVFASGNTGNSPSGASIPANTGNDSATQTVAAGLGATVPAEPHTHPMGAITDPGHVHTVADTGHTHAKGSFAVDATGTPATMLFPMYVKL